MASAQTPTFGALLRRYRVAAGLTQEQLAARAGLSARGISDLEAGRRLTPRRETLELLLQALQLPIEQRDQLQAAASRQPSATATLEPPPSDRLQPVLVGRAAELALLDRQLRKAGPPLLLLTGEPGIGKTRLLRETALRAQARGWTVLEGGCHRRSGQEPYAPFLGALERFLASRSLARQRLDLQGCAWLVRLLPELSERKVVPAPAWTLPPEQERRLMFAAVGRFLVNIAGPAGTLLVLDDLHWAGSDALDLLAALVRASPAPPLRIVGAYRHTDLQSQDPLAILVGDLAREELVVRGELGPLAASEAAALLDGILGATPDAAGEPVAALREQVLRRAGGVPFFLVSCAQALRVGAFSGSAADGAVPWTVAESIRQRAAALSEAARTALDVAAVLGRTVPRAILMAAASRSGWSEPEMLAALEAACRARLLVEEGAHVFRFSHDLIREVLAGDLGATRRALLHRQVAATLEQETDDPPVEALAYHYARADMDEKAIFYLERAGDRARALHAHAAAEGYYRQLMERLDARGRLAHAAQAREQLGTVLATLARYDEALQTLERAGADYRASGCPEANGRVTAQIGRIHAVRGTLADGIARLRQPDLDASALSAPTRAALDTALAHLCYSAGRQAEALAAAEQAAQHARAAASDRLLAAAERFRGAALVALGRLEEATEALQTAIPLAEAGGDLESLCYALFNLGLVHHAKGELAYAMSCYERALAVAEQMDNPRLIAHMRGACALDAFGLGDWDRARADFEASMALMRQLGMPWVAMYPAMGLGSLSLAQGRWEEGNQYLQEALTLAERVENLEIIASVHCALAQRELLSGRPELARARLEPLRDRALRQPADALMVLPNLAWAYLETGDESGAAALLTDAMALEHASPARFWLVDILRVRALLAARQRRSPDANAALQQALALSRSLGAPYAEAQALYTAGSLYLQRNEPALARPHLEASRAILDRLGERLYAAHVEQALSSRIADP